MHLSGMEHKQYGVWTCCTMWECCNMKLSKICVARHTRHQLTALPEPHWDYSGSVEDPLKITGLVCGSQQ